LVRVGLWLSRPTDKELPCRSRRRKAENTRVSLPIRRSSRRPSVSIQRGKRLTSTASESVIHLPSRKSHPTELHLHRDGHTPAAAVVGVFAIAGSQRNGLSACAAGMVGRG
jgi:hypothetical protein